MKKYIMTEAGLTDTEDNNPIGVLFPTGTTGQTYLESEIQFVEQMTKPGTSDGWYDCDKRSKYLFPFHSHRTIARIRTPQVGEFERGVMEERERTKPILEAILTNYIHMETIKNILACIGLLTVLCSGGIFYIASKTVYKD